jgi:hypothetical protein
MHLVDKRELHIPGASQHQKGHMPTQGREMSFYEGWGIILTILFLLWGAITFIGLFRRWF